MTTLRQLHESGLLILPNAWDAGSARLVESLGARAIATTSAGVAWSHGYADGDVLPVRLLVATVEDIARIVRVPLTIDCEGGYSGDPAAVAETVGAVAAAGAAGINIQDGTDDPDLLCAKIEAIRRDAARRGVDIFINARTDVYLRGLGPGEGRVEMTLARAERYRAAGADGLFVPGLVDAAGIRAIAAGTPLPLNVMARPGLPAARELASLGARRLSGAAWMAEVVFAKVKALAAGFLETGDSGPLTEGAMPYPDINELMATAAP
jgi:2-methylisocitrate lyase-like PEP mutase family enzyme